MEENKTKKDLTEFYIEKTERLINEIDSYKEFMKKQKYSFIIEVNNKLNELFKHIKSLLKEDKKKEDIQKQLVFNIEFKKISAQTFFYKKKMIDGEIKRIVCYKKKNYNKLLEFIDDREDHLNDLLFNLGLSITKIKGKAF